VLQSIYSAAAKALCYRRPSPLDSLAPQIESDNLDDSAVAHRKHLPSQRLTATFSCRLGRSHLEPDDDPIAENRHSDTFASAPWSFPR
jgi:hypothetical protein